MSLSIVIPCYVHIATSLAIVASQWISLATSLPIIVPQWGIPINVMSNCDVIMSHENKSSAHRGNIHKKVVSTGVI